VGFFIEGMVFDVEGEVVFGVFNVSCYNWDFDNVENKKFVEVY